MSERRIMLGQMGAMAALIGAVLRVVDQDEGIVVRPPDDQVPRRQVAVSEPEAAVAFAPHRHTQTREAQRRLRQLAKRKQP